MIRNTFFPNVTDVRPRISGSANLITVGDIYNDQHSSLIVYDSINNSLEIIRVIFIAVY